MFRRLRKRRFRNGYLDKLSDYEVHDTGWISPDGKFYPCKFSYHSLFGNVLKRDIYGDFDEEKSIKRRGWIGFSNYILNVDYHLYPRGMTSKQVDLVYDYMVENDLDYIKSRIVESSPFSSLGISVTDERIKRKDLYDMLLD